MFVLVRFTSDDASYIVRIDKPEQSHVAVEALQAQRAARGKQTGCAWQFYQGDWVGALIASTKI